MMDEDVPLANQLEDVGPVFEGKRPAGGERFVAQVRKSVQPLPVDERGEIERTVDLENLSGLQLQRTPNRLEEFAIGPGRDFEAHRFAVA